MVCLLSNNTTSQQFTQPQLLEQSATTRCGLRGVSSFRVVPDLIWVLKARFVPSPQIHTLAFSAATMYQSRGLRERHRTRREV